MRLTSCLLALTLASCAAAPDEARTAATAGFAIAPYRAALDSAAVYRVSAQRSRADVIVRSEGPLQRIGHDHVITAGAIDGYVLLAEPGSGDSHADLTVDLGALTVDAADARSVFGLSSGPSEGDIARTAANLHEKVLETGLWREAHVSITLLERLGDTARCEVTVHLRGKRHSFPVFVQLDHDNARLRARGVFDLRQTDLGLEPFSVLAGALSVRDRIEIAFRIEADRIRQIEPATPP